MEQKTEAKIEKLQLLEQNMQNFAIQKQNFQAQLLEIENGLKELDNAKEPMFKIVGNIMISSDKEKLKNDLTSKKELYELRLNNIKKQEEALKDEVKDLQEEVLSGMKNKNDKNN